MKFLLLHIAPPYQIFSMSKKYKSNMSIPPLGLLYIARSLEDEGHTVEIIDFNYEKHPMRSLNKSIHSSDAIGINVNSLSYKKVVNTTNKIKEIETSIPIIIGGPHCCFFPRRSLDDIPKADISVDGEAENVIKDITKALQGKKDYSKIHGIHYRDNGKIKKGQSPKIIENLDSIPFPSRHLVEKYDYGMFNNKAFFKKRFTSLITSRGCPYNCRFCTRNISTFSHFRKRSVKNIGDELEEIDQKYNSVMIVDDNFFSDSKRIHKIMDHIIEKQLSIDFVIEGTRVDSADIELYRKMKKAGVKQLFFGIESGNQDVLDFYNKNISTDQIKKAVKLASRMGFLTTGNFILGAPIETKQHIKNTMKFACSLPLDVVLFNPLGYVHGSDLWKEAVDNGKIGTDEEYQIIADSRRGLGNFTSQELDAFCNEAFKRFYGRPTYMIRLFIRSIIRRDLRFVRLGFDYF